MESMPSAVGGQTLRFPVVYVIFGGAAFLSTVLLPLAFTFVIRRYGPRSPPPGRRSLGAPGTVHRGNLQQEEPKLFDIYVKPGLEVHEARFEYILPMAAWIKSESHAPLITDALSPLPNVPRTHCSLRSRGEEVDEAGAPVQGDVSQTLYDVAVLIIMPHPYAADSWGGLGEYAIGITGLVSPVSRDDFTSQPLHPI